MTARPTVARRRTTIARTLVIVAALAAGLSGCSGSDAGSGSDSDTSDGSDREDAEEPSAKESLVGALDKLRAEAYADLTDETSSRKQMEVEELMATCMAEQGFEYIPVDFSAVPSGPSHEAMEDTPMGTLEFAEQWGYGITTDPWMDPETVAEQEAAAAEWVNPNAAITAAMSRTELAAYDAAAYGEQSADGTDQTELTWEQMGCSGYAQQEVWGSLSDADNPFAELEEEMWRVEEQIPTDDRVLALESAWSSCMADAGHPNLATVADAKKSINDKLTPILAAGGPDDVIAAKLVEMNGEEVTLAVDDYTCREESGYAAAYDAVDIELQQQFYDAHKTDLDAWVAYTQERTS